MTRLALALVLTLVAPFAFAGTIKGIVVDSETQAPIAGALVGLTGEGRDKPVRAKTNAKGEYTFINVPAGSYTVSSIADGYRLMVRTSVGVQDDHTTRLNLVLQRAPETPKQ